jgi:hypothetical protein
MKTEWKMKYFGHIKLWRRMVSWNGIYQEGERGGGQKGHWFRISQMILQIIASDTEHHAYD